MTLGDNVGTAKFVQFDNTFTTGLGVEGGMLVHATLKSFIYSVSSQAFATAATMKNTGFCFSVRKLWIRRSFQLNMFSMY